MLEALKNLFRKPSAAPYYPTLKDVSEEFDHDYEPRYPNAQPPIIVLNPIDDSSLEVLGQIVDLADHLGVDLYNSNLFQYYQSAVGDDADLPADLDEDELELMQQWTRSSTLPERFRQSLVDFFCRVDDVSERILNLSQYRYERLRTWSNCHV